MNAPLALAEAAARTLLPLPLRAILVLDGRGEVEPHIRSRRLGRAGLALLLPHLLLLLRRRRGTWPSGSHARVPLLRRAQLRDKRAVQRVARSEEWQAGPLLQERLECPLAVGRDEFRRARDEQQQRSLVAVGLPLLLLRLRRRRLKRSATARVACFRLPVRADALPLRLWLVRRRRRRPQRLVRRRRWRLRRLLLRHR